ncbi:flagellar motor protein MotB [Frigidibacter sp. SD6-1]|uniref:flagellar motor protein MotB n=1 Tax=Frigidibacter sp. SD6-1 TaxID=3032581 RepID=UPI0024E0213B|nr:flagellar motor protein MotB [Frigidibacter sp. SD6-1]
MARQSNAAPVIIKRKKVSGGDGHHGGAWKVAYADFVTAMMAFFMLMWLLNATTEKQRKGIADYFSPTIPLSRISGGGDGSFGGESVFSEDQIAQNGTGASSLKPTTEDQALGQTGTESLEDPPDKGKFDEEVRKIEEALMGIGGESMVSDEVMRHITTRVTDEGLIIEFFDVENDPLFEEGTAIPRPVVTELAGVLNRVFGLVTNQVAINGHIRAQPAVLKNNPAWDLSAKRAMQMRKLIEATGFAPARIQRVTGFADRKPALKNPLAIRNSRLEIILLRKGK